MGSILITAPLVKVTEDRAAAKAVAAGRKTSSDHCGDWGCCPPGRHEACVLCAGWGHLQGAGTGACCGDRAVLCRPVASAPVITVPPPAALPQLQPHVQRGAQHVPHGPGRVHCLTGQHRQVRPEPVPSLVPGVQWGGGRPSSRGECRLHSLGMALVVCPPVPEGVWLPTRSGSLSWQQTFQSPVGPPWHMRKVPGDVGWSCHVNPGVMVLSPPSYPLSRDEGGQKLSVSSGPARGGHGEPDSSFVPRSTKKHHGMCPPEDGPWASPSWAVRGGSFFLALVRPGGLSVTGRTGSEDVCGPSHSEGPQGNDHSPVPSWPHSALGLSLRPSCPPRRAGLGLGQRAVPG